MANLYEKLKKYGKKNICPMHMPGHKRKMGLCADIDITEIDDFDNLANPSGILKDLQDSWAKAYGADKAFLSVNGSTGAILSAICAVCKRGDKIIMARNCHKSVYNAAEIMELEVSYVFPDYDDNGIAKPVGISAVSKVISDNPDAKLLVLTSPTYEGVISDIDGICKEAHKYDIPVFVDSAHGAHLKFMQMPFPTDTGADIASVSLHKTLPSMTQTALLLLKGERVNAEVIKEKMNVFQTSSPSYVLMASMGECLDFVENAEAFKDYEKNLNEFYESSANFKKLKIVCDNADKGKIVILTNGTDISGNELKEALRKKYKIELEMAYDLYALAMTSVCDRKKDFKRLYNALADIDGKIERKDAKIKKYPKPQKADYDKNGDKLYLSYKEAEGKVCVDFVWAYPPGVPIIAKGEVLDKETVNYILNLSGTKLYGRNGSDENKILIYR